MTTIQNVPKGTVWLPGIAISDNNGALDCTGKDAWMVIKEKDSFSAPLYLRLDIEWTERDEGKGYFELPESNTQEMSVKEYYFDIYLSMDEGTRRIKKGVLNIVESLNPDSI